jgi:hypothetical protein
LRQIETPRLNNNGCYEWNENNELEHNTVTSRKYIIF